MNAGQDREARRRQQTDARRKSGRAASVRARKKRQRTIMRVTGLGVGAVVVLAVVLIVVSVTKGDTPPPEASHDIRVVAHDFNYDPDPLLGLAGTINFTLANDGLVGHDLVVLKQGVRISTASDFDSSTELGRLDSLAPGYEAKLSLDLQPGRYQIVCLVPNHLEQGSTVDLIVS